MTLLKENYDVVAFLVTKHSWKGKYRRVLSIGTYGITTYNPERMEVTNRWAYSEISTLSLARHSSAPAAAAHDFTLVLRRDKKTDTLRFSSEHRPLILTEAFKYRTLFADKPKHGTRYEAYKHHWSDVKLPVVLEVTPCSLDQRDPATHALLASYPYTDIQGLVGVSDYAGGLVVAVGGHSRLHLFSCSSHEALRAEIVKLAGLYLGLHIKVLSEDITLRQFQEQRFGQFSSSAQQTSLSEFGAHKEARARHREPARRTLCVSDACLLERDPHTYSLVCLRPLADVFALVRAPDHPQRFSVEYQSGHTRTYLAAERDALLATLLDAVRSAGNRDVHVRSSHTPRHKRLGPLHTPVDEETEANHLRLLQNPGGMSRGEAIERFNANIGYSGLLYSVNQDRLFAENKEKLICGALSGLTSVPAGAVRELPLLELEGLFHALRRLCASKAGFAAFTSLPGLRDWVGAAVVAALRRGDAASSHAALDATCALLQPMHADPDLRQEQLNKSSMLAGAPFLSALLDMWSERVAREADALVVAAMLDLLTFALCTPYSETTDSHHFDALLDMVAARGRLLFKLFEHPSLAIVKGAGLVARALVEEGAPGVGERLQALALAEAALPRHLLAALYSQRPQHRHLARHLLGLWCAGHAPAVALLKRILPAGLLAFLESAEMVPDDATEALDTRDNLHLASAAAPRPRAPQWAALERHIKTVERQLEQVATLALQHWAVGARTERRDTPRDRPVVLRRRRERLKAQDNWPYFYYQFQRDHAAPNLIWNHTTREELRTALEAELRAFESDRELALAGDASALVAWNHRELELHYPCLQNEVKIGDYYLRLLLEQRDNEDSPIRRSYEFFNELYHRFLSTPKVEMKCMCLQAMSIVYGRYHEDIGPFADTKYIVQMLDRTCDKQERDRLVQFLSTLVQHRGNVSALLEWGGVRVLLELATLAHLHTARATVPAQSNVIEAGHSADKGGEREWYYNVEEASGVKRVGPVSVHELSELFASGAVTPRTKCWANGMEGWRALQAVPQLKWTLVARGNAVWDESELALACLEVLSRCASYFPARDHDGAVVRPLPRVKRLLSEPATLSHVVQLLLTFHPPLVERVASLLHEVMADNPAADKLYLTGLFYFALLYPGGNVLPVAKLLHSTHLLQAARPDDEAGGSEAARRSALAALLPEAMVCYLHNHGAEKFAQIFLGEFDTPEAIWSADMRRWLAMKVAAHVGEFTPRLRANVAARYPYLAIPAVRYPQLERELFCHTFYLRHLCDEARFPSWPIPEPVALLAATLAAWHRELQRKPPPMTVEQARAALGLTPEADEAAARRAYYKLAQQFHPDKNPAGRERFESVSRAYEFLCSRSAFASAGPDPERVVLLLRTQTILYTRHAAALAEYKYAGYGPLLDTVRAQTDADHLFSDAPGTAGLLAAACELAHATVACSALNAEELRREGGLEALREALSRCVAVLSRASRPSDVAAVVSEHCCRCFAVAAQFPECLALLSQDRPLLGDVVRVVRFRHLGGACCAAAEAVAALAAAADARYTLARAGALHALLAAALQYDYTLNDDADKVEVEGASKEPSPQEMANRLARLSLSACARLACLPPPLDAGAAADADIRAALDALLTRHLSSRLAHEAPAAVLDTLANNWRTPYLVWDNSTRAELGDLVEASWRPESDEAPLVPPDFRFSAHQGVLAVGGVYLDIYNDQPSFPITEPVALVRELLSFVRSACTSPAAAPVDSERLNEAEQALQALANVLVTNPGAEIGCAGQLALLLGLVGAWAAPTLQVATLRALEAVSGSRECVEEIAACDALGPLLSLLAGADDSLRGGALTLLTALSAHTKLVREMLDKGGVAYLLALFACSQAPDIRRAAADLLARLMADKLHGPRVRLVVTRHVPTALADALRDGGAVAVQTFDDNHEQPELVWGEKSRQAVRQALATIRDNHYSRQLRSPNALLTESVPEIDADWTPTGEVVVGGVYLRLFLQNPQWAVRSPKNFLRELLHETLTELSRDETQNVRAELCSRALAALVRARPALGDAAAQAGELPRLARLLPRRPALALPVLAALAAAGCSAALASTECVAGLSAALRGESGTEHAAAACEALAALCGSGALPHDLDRLAVQALDTGLVSRLLALLESRLPAHARAQLVTALKALSRAPGAGERVRAELGKCGAWEQYAAQRHDLFLTSEPNNLLTDGPPAPRILPPPPPAAPHPPH